MTPSGLFMFLIAGISPKTVTIDENPVACPSCGLVCAYRSRVDHYINLFFVPIIRVKKGATFLSCRHCHRQDNPFTHSFADPLRRDETVCPDCGKQIGDDFTFCPYCGKRL